MPASPEIKAAATRTYRRVERQGWRASQALAATSLLLAVTLLAGSAFTGADLVRRVLPFQIHVMPAKALCFALLSAGLLAWSQQTRTAFMLAFWSGAAVALLAVLNIGSKTFGQPLGLDPSSFTGGSTASAMTYATSVELLLAAYCLCALARRKFWHPQAFSFSATTGLLSALVAAIGYVFGSRSLSEVLVMDAMAPYAAMNFLLLNLALLLSRPSASWLRLLFGSGAGSAVARRLFPVAVAAPLLLCFLVHAMTNAGMFSSSFRLGFLAIAMMTVSAIAVLWNAHAENWSEFLAFHDPLTGLPNRSLFSERLAEALARADESGGKVGVVLCDLDRFKTINDRMGHFFGDSLLRLTSGRLRTAIRSSDTPARIGGDEFAVILADRPTERDIKSGTEKICEAVVEPADIDGHLLEPTASFGVAIYPADASEIDALMRRADLALHEAKTAPHAHLCYFDESLAIVAQDRARVESGLRDAIRRGEMLLHFQPQFDLATRRVRSIEALVRWRRGDRQIVGPGEFVPVAEATGLIRPLGRWVLNEACRQQARWRAQGFDVTMAINVSPVEAADDEFPTFLEEALDAAGIDGRAIELEITEGLLLKHEGRAVRRFLEACQQREVRLAIDDFGTGYSSLSYLKSLPISKIKIDRSFAEGLGQHKDDMLVKALIEVGHQLGKRVVAEGVEADAQLEALQSFGCDDAQGYLLCPPAEAAAVEHHLR